MGQVIEVRFYNTLNGEVLANEFTLTSTKTYSPTSHEPMHREAIELALHKWSGGMGTLKTMTREGNVTRAGSGCSTAWKYRYMCLLSGEELEDKTDREILAVLFTEYCEKGTVGIDSTDHAT